MKDVTMFVCHDCDRVTFVETYQLEKVDTLYCAFCRSEWVSKVSEYDLECEEV